MANALFRWLFGSSEQKRRFEREIRVRCAFDSLEEIDLEDGYECIRSDADARILTLCEKTIDQSSSVFFAGVEEILRDCYRLVRS